MAQGWLDRCAFLAIFAGTADFVPSSPVPGFLTPAQANAVNGVSYRYAAEVRDGSNTIIAWEVGTGLWSSGTLQRTTVEFSSNSNAKVNFAVAPVVMITASAADFVAGPLLNVKSFGAKGDGVTDDTAAIQAAINYIVSNSLALLFPAGIYIISAAINIPFGAGWQIYGTTQLSTIIKQITNNTPIWSFTQNNVHSWRIADFFHTWASAQSSANTHACAFWFTGDDYGRYNFIVERCICDNGFRFFSNDNSVSPLTWGATIRNCTHYDTNSGGFWNMAQAVSIGQPSVSIDDCNVNAAGMSQTEDLIHHNAGEDFGLHHFEANQVTNQVVVRLTGCRGSIGAMKLETATYTTPGANILVFQNSFVVAESILLGALTINIPASNMTAVLHQTAGQLVIQDISFTFAAITAGTFYVIGTSPFSSSFSCRLINPPGGIIGQANAYLTNVGSTASAEGVTVDAWQQPRLTGDIGDANFTWNIGVNPNTILCLTQLTADRTVTLADESGGADSNLFDGVVVRVVRNAGTPGAFNLFVNNSAGSHIATLASTNGSIDLMWQRFGWRVTNYTTWTGTAP
jgi:hypothetical protein